MFHWFISLVKAIFYLFAFQIYFLENNCPIDFLAELKEVRLLIGSDPETALVLATDLADKIKSVEDKDLRSDVFHATGLAYHEVKQFDEALIWYHRALDLRMETGNKKGQSITLNNIGLIFHDTGRFQESVPYYYKSIDLKLELHELKSLTATYENLGTSFLKLSEYTRAMEMYYKALKISEDEGDIARTAMTYQNMGILHHYQGNNRYALELFEKAKEIQRVMNDKVALVHLDNNIGLALMELKRHKEALQNFEECLTLSRGIKYNAGILTSANNIGRILTRMNKLPDALSTFKECLELAGAESDYSAQCTAASNIGEIYLMCKDYSNAYKYMNQALLLSRKIGAKNIEAEIFKRLSWLYECMKKPARALQYHKRYDKLKNSIINIQNANDISQLQTKYELDKKEEQVQRARLLQVESELKALRAQMNPHFIFNSLNAIQRYIWKNDPEKATSYLASFAKLIRLVLENSRDTYVSLERDLEALDYYIQLESLRFENEFTYEIICDPEIDKEGIRVPPLILQPYVENAIIHGLHPSKKACALKIEITINAEDTLFITIKDNGVGRLRPVAEKVALQNGSKKSLGMEVTQQRLEKGTGNVVGKVRIIDLLDEDGRSGGTLVEIELPVCS